MLRLLLLAFIVFVAHQPLYTQVPDFIALKKRNGVSVKNYYAGGWPITFKAKNGAVYEGPIEKIDNDSIYVKFFDVRKYRTIWETYSNDTINAYVVPFHYKEIDHIILPVVRKRKHYLFTLGKMMQWGGFGYDVVNIVNSVYLKDSFTSKRNLRNVGIATAVGLAGTLIKSRYGNPYRNPRRYRIVYIDMDHQP